MKTYDIGNLHQFRLTTLKARNHDFMKRNHYGRWGRANFDQIDPSQRKKGATQRQNLVLLNIGHRSPISVQQFR